MVLVHYFFNTTLKYLGSSFSYIAECLVVLEVSLPLRIWLTQRVSNLGVMRPIHQPIPANDPTALPRPIWQS